MAQVCFAFFLFLFDTIVLFYKHTDLWEHTDLCVPTDLWFCNRLL